MNAKEIRTRFLEYFASHHHAVVPSSSLIPAQDPTLLFTNAGMNQFKDLFLGKEKRSYSKATSAQKCVRAGGKHNDLEQVGFTARHLTFFEMLGNFSFGDYFKKEAIQHAWDLLTNGYNLDKNRLYVSVFETDDESYELWNRVVGLDASRIIRLGEKDNFWSMGDTGPCGPCTEIYYDLTPEKPLGWNTQFDDTRYIEIWNLVFMQYNRSQEGALEPLSQTGVDTGMGFERLCSVLQNKPTVFETDVFSALHKAIKQYTEIDYATASPLLKGACNVLFDHVRSSSLLIADGCTPANDGRGYVLRKIIRRAALFTQKLTTDTHLFTQLAEAFIKDQKEQFPELGESQELITAILQNEVDRFTANLQQGQSLVLSYIEAHKEAGKRHITGKEAFTLYDTYGFPLELTQVIAREHGFTVDTAGFEEHMAYQQALSKQQSDALNQVSFPETLQTTFTGYQTLEENVRILWAEPTYDNMTWVITDRSPFYVASGGQVNDCGTFYINEKAYQVMDLQKAGNRFTPAIAHLLKPHDEKSETIKEGDTARCIVNQEHREDVVRNHTATHLLHAALRSLLGSHVKQAGSLVTADYLRFDYNHHEALTPEVITTLENTINTVIWQAIPTHVTHTTLEKAQEKGAMAFFGEKYNPESVRVVSVPGFSIELCGGTHASNTGIIGSFKITSDTALSTGTRRITAVTGRKALSLFQDTFGICKHTSERFKTTFEEIIPALDRQQEIVQTLQRDMRALKKELLSSQLSSFTHHIKKESSIPYALIIQENLSYDELRTIAISMQNNTPGIYGVMSKEEDNKVRFILSTHSTHQETIPHTTLTSFISHYGLRGGGKPGLIQGGGVNVNISELEKGLKELIISLT